MSAAHCDQAATGLGARGMRPRDGGADDNGGKVRITSSATASADDATAHRSPRRA